MPNMKVITNGDGCWPDLKDKTVIHTQLPFEVALLRGGMASGGASVSFRIGLPDGRVVIAETSLELLTTAARALNAANERTH